MAATVTPPYPHRQNRDGSWDSICHLCHATVANVRDESKLVDLEVVHICNESFLADRGVLSSLVEKRRAA
jgi:hypothetical protein